MKSGHYILPFCLSVVIHVGVLLAGGPGHTADAPFDPGLAAVRLRLAPSPEVRAAAPPVVVEPEPARPVEPPKPEPLAAIAPPMPELPDQPVVEAPPAEPVEPVEVVEVVEPIEQTEPAEPVESPQPPAETRAEAAPPKPVKAEIAATASTPSVARDGDVREAGVTPARAIGPNTLVYPRVARRLGQQGTVTVEVEVLTTGRAGNVRLVTSSGHKRLDRAVVKHMEKCRFRPAHNGRHAVKSTLRIPYKFELTKANR